MQPSESLFSNDFVVNTQYPWINYPGLAKSLWWIGNVGFSMLLVVLFLLFIIKKMDSNIQTKKQNAITNE